MPNTLKVSLDESVTPWVVEIDQKDNANHVGRGSAAQTITWQLTGNAASGNIVSLVWLTPAPPNGIFGTPTISGNGNVMTMTDLNNTAATSGDWAYRLTIEVNGQNYSTTASIDGTTTNPTIKNN